VIEEFGLGKEVVLLELTRWIALGKEPVGDSGAEFSEGCRLFKKFSYLNFLV
jgi:hypothetical protein